MTQSFPAPSEELFHYTSAPGALGIIESGTVRATMVHYMNDAREFSHAISIARELIADSRSVPADKAADVCETFLTAIQSIAVYVFSLSEHSDQLSQWRAYAVDGGYALAIPRSQLLAIAKKNDAELVRCEYDPVVQRAMLKPIIDDMLEAAGKLGGDVLGLELYEPFAARFTSAAASIKHPSFHEEAEWRLISCIGAGTARVSWRTAGGLIVPYCEWSLLDGAQYPVSRVIVGPAVSADLAARSLRHLVAARYRWPVKVALSAAPLRPLR